MVKQKKLLRFFTFLSGFTFVVLLALIQLPPTRGPLRAWLFGKRTVADVVAEVGPAAFERLGPYFVKAGVPYPPSQVTLLVDKERQELEVWARGTEEFALIRSYTILRSSGTEGPKLREGDRQVPEGKYRIIGLNPNSSFHLSLKLDYPNDFDRRKAELEGRSDLGGDIFIHGKAVSIGCLAMGDSVIEELFVLAAQAGKEAFTVIIAPRDPRRQKLEVRRGLPLWTGELYRDIESAFSRYSLS